MNGSTWRRGIVGLALASGMLAAAVPCDAQSEFSYSFFQGGFTDGTAGSSGSLSGTFTGIDRDGDGVLLLSGGADNEFTNLTAVWSTGSAVMPVTLTFPASFNGSLAYTLGATDFSGFAGTISAPSRFTVTEAGTGCSQGWTCSHIASSAGDYTTTDSGSITAVPTGAAPEPGTWLLLVGGFGLVGSMLRRHPRAFRAAAAS